MELTSLVLLVVLPAAGAILGLALGRWLYLRALRELQYGLADLEDRLIREVKKRAAQDRWDKTGPDPAEVRALEGELAKGLLPPDEFIRRKQAMIYGPRQVPREGG